MQKTQITEVTAVKTDNNKKSQKEILYIAYGSNLNLAQMAGRCPTAEVVGKAMLRGWRLAFRSVATIERCAGYNVPVLVWKLQPQDEHALDRYEGWPHLYYKETLKISLGGKRRTAMVYIMNGNSHPYSPPARSYMRTILSGYESAGFDPGILYQAAGEALTAGLTFPGMDKAESREGGVGR